MRWTGKHLSIRAGIHGKRLKAQEGSCDHRQKTRAASTRAHLDLPALWSCAHRSDADATWFRYACYKRS